MSSMEPKIPGTGPGLLPPEELGWQTGTGYNPESEFQASQAPCLPPKVHALWHPL